MARKKKPNIPKPAKKHPEAQGFFLLAACSLLLLSLVSFDLNQEDNNYIGSIGYYTTYILNYFFGLGNYLFVFLLGYLSFKRFKNEKILYSGFKLFCFGAIMISVCMLLSIFAESLPEKAALLSKKVYTETVFFTYPHPHQHVRYNLGGVPFYYIFHDLPYLNLQKLLSPAGAAIIFSIIGLAAFLLLTGIRLLPNLRAGFLSFGMVCKKCNPFGIFKWIFDLIKKARLRRREKKLSAPPVIKKAISYPAPPIKKMSLPIFKAKPQVKKEKKPLLNLPAILKQPSNYSPPDFELLSNPPPIDHPSLKKELKRQGTILEETLKSFGIEAQVGSINCGPTITSFEVHPAIGVKVQKITTLANDIALNMEAKSIRIIAPIPGKAAIGVEVPSLYPQQVSFKEMLLSYHQSNRRMNIPILLGKSVSGEHVVADLAKMPHCLIAGATGSGKSVCINTIVMSILMSASPDEVRLLMIDPKKVELTQYSALPHMIAPVITEAHGAYAALQWLVKEMQSRYDILKQMGLRNITAFNKRKIEKKFEESLGCEIPEKMPFFVAIIDEFADLMMVSSTDLETPIARIAQMARAVGIHLILATQRPSREVITGIIKANFPTRIAFKVASRVNSHIILDETGAESLLGNGDLLFLPPGTSHLVRAQGAYISDEEINRIIEAICSKSRPSYLIPSFDNMESDASSSEDGSRRDNLYDQALLTVLESKNASTTFLQRKLKIGYARAASLMDELEENGVISAPDGSRARKVIKQY